jgi:hypothetical protein
VGHSHAMAYSGVRRGDDLVKGHAPILPPGPEPVFESRWLRTGHHTRARVTIVVQTQRRVFVRGV